MSPDHRKLAQPESNSHRRRRTLAQQRAWGRQRRTLGIVTILGLAAAATGGTLAYLNNRPKDSGLGSDFPEIRDYYPELAGYEVKASGKFTTEAAQVPVTWVNLTNNEFDSEAANQTMSSFESLARGQLSLIMQKDGVGYVAEIYPPMANTQTFFYIVDRNHPNPGWASGSKNRGLTFKGFGVRGSPLNLVFVRTVPSDNPDVMQFFRTPQVSVNNTFTTEFCQASVLVATPTRPDLHLFTQEAFCNGFSDALTFRQKGATFEEYGLYVKNGAYTFTTAPGETATLGSLFSADKYYQLPQLPPVITIDH